MGKGGYQGGLNRMLGLDRWRSGANQDISDRQEHIGVRRILCFSSLIVPVDDDWGDVLWIWGQDGAVHHGATSDSGGEEAASVPEVQRVRASAGRHHVERVRHRMVVQADNIPEHNGVYHPGQQPPVAGR
jgi:hypothetical protein